MSFRISRRGLVAGGAATLALGSGRVAASEGIVEIRWGDLVPGGTNPFDKALDDMIGDIISHEAAEALGLMDGRPDHYAEVVTEWNGRRIRLPGYMVPMAFDGTGVTELLLVPYVGACIHVPPPPPNQIVLVTADDPYPVTGFFEPI
ncbi:MAG: DUF3299 domain-containing protein, partial [Pseudomonadota bacterium]